MIDYLVGLNKGLTYMQAYQLISVAGNVAVTQIVDLPNVGVHVRVPKSIFKK
jgi:acetamidase/formamidase